MELHLRVDGPAGGRRHIGPSDLDHVRCPGWMKYARVRVESVRDYRPDVHREAMHPFANPVGGVDLLARCHNLPTHSPILDARGTKEVQDFARVEEPPQTV